MVTSRHVRKMAVTTGSTIPVNPVLHANLMALSFIESELWAIEVYIAGIGILDILCSCDHDS